MLPQQAEAQARTPPPVPGDIHVEAGNKVFLAAHAIGTQNYICLPSASGFAWTLVGPHSWPNGCSKSSLSRNPFLRPAYFQGTRRSFPEMLRELAETIRHGNGERQKCIIKKTGAAHGNARWKTGFRLDEVLRELDRIRETLLREIQALTPAPTPAEFEPIVQDIHQFFRLVASTSWCCRWTTARMFVFWWTN